MVLKLSFVGNSLEISPSVDFHSIPQSTLLTLAMETPHAWQAFPKESIQDLDNIRLSDLKASARERGVDALFELSNIIVEGHARESKSGAPPRGLQLVLDDGKQTVDTLVMANLGYYQLKANPGIWNLSIREGRSTDVFELETVDLNTPTADKTVAVTTFEGVTVFPRFKRKPGMDGVDLLDEEWQDGQSKAKSTAGAVLSGFKDRSVYHINSAQQDKIPTTSSVFCRVQSFFGRPVEAPVIDLAKTHTKGAEINIFTVASGLLYEVRHLL